MKNYQYTLGIMLLAMLLLPVANAAIGVHTADGAGGYSPADPDPARTGTDRTRGGSGQLSRVNWAYGGTIHARARYSVCHQRPVCF